MQTSIGNGCGTKPVRTISEMDVKVVFGIMATLSYRQRAILSLRHFEKMSFSTIAEILDLGYLQTVFHLFSVKRTLKKQLSAVGLGSSSLVDFIDLFGKLTAFPGTQQLRSFNSTV